MEEVIYYLELKNEYYEKFFNATKSLLDFMRENRWDMFRSFVDLRERTIHMIRTYDFKIARAFASIDVTQCRLATYRSRVKQLLDERRIWIDRILTLDLELLGRIDEVKSDELQKLRQSVSATQILASKD